MIKKLEEQKKVIKKNMQASSLFTFLIKRAGNCEAYSSDIVYDIERIKKYMKSYNNNEEEDNTFYIGFRRTGVDGNEFVKCRFENNGLSEYNELYVIKVINQNYVSLYSVPV